MSDQNTPPSELSDDQLEAASGGCFYDPGVSIEPDPIIKDPVFGPICELPGPVVTPPICEMPGSPTLSA